MRLSFRLALLGALVAHAPASAQLIAYDGFNYTPGNLDGLNGGSGWTTDGWSSAAPSAQVTTGSLTPTVPDLLTSGNSISTVGLNGNSTRALNTTLGTASGTVWASVLIQRTSNTVDDSVGGMTLGGVFVGDGGSGVFRIADAGAPSGLLSPSQESTISVMKGRTYLLVLQIDATLATGNPTLNLYVDPTPGATDPGTPAVTRSDLTVTDIDQISLVYQGGDYLFDEVRVGNSYADVVPVTPAAEPAGLLAAAAVGAWLLRRRLL
jgi:hypothetical protein